MFELLNHQVILWGIPMSIVDIIGSIMGIIYIILEYKASKWLWPACVIMGICIAYSCFTNKLYANGAINVYYVLMAFYGIYTWQRMRRLQKQGHPEAVVDEAPMQSMPRQYLPWVLISVVLLTAVLFFILRALGEFTVVRGVNLALLDALTSSISIMAMWMLAKKYYQQWIGWIIVDPIAVVLFFLSGNYPLAVMYAFYVSISVMGYCRWKREYHQTQTAQ